MKKLNLTLAIFIFIISKSICSNTLTDSLRLTWENEEKIDSIRFNALDEYHSIYSHVMPDSVLITLDYYYDLAKRKKAIRQIYRALLRKGNIYRLQYKFEEAIKNYQEAEIYAERMNNSRLQALIHGNLGNVYLYQRKYFEAIQLYNKAKKIFIEDGDLEGEGRMLLSIGAVNSSIGNNDLALIHYQESLTIYEKAENSEHSLAILSMNVGFIHFNKESYKDAERYFNRALRLLQTKNDKFFIKDCFHSLGQIKLELNEIEAAYAYAHKSLLINQDLDTREGIIASLILLAKIDYSRNRDKAITEMEGILKQTSKSSTFEIQKEIYEFLWYGYKSQEKWRLSLKMHELFLSYSDSIKDSKNSFSVVREVVKNEYEAKLFESQLENEQEQDKLKLHQFKKIVLIIFIAILSLLALIYFTIVKDKKNTARKNLLLNEIKQLKNIGIKSLSNPNTFKLSKDKIDVYLNKALNDTDWTILLILFENPVATNKEIAEKSFLSVDGVKSSLSRMYVYFEINETKYKKVALLHKAIKTSNTFEEI